MNDDLDIPLHDIAFADPQRRDEIAFIAQARQDRENRIGELRRLQAMVEEQEMLREAYIEARRKELEQEEELEALKKGTFRSKKRDKKDVIPNISRRAELDEDNPYQLAISTSETRSMGELKLYYDRVLLLFRETFPLKFLPDLALHIEGEPGKPFATRVKGSYCFMSPLILASSDETATKMFTKMTPRFKESRQRLLDSVDCFYYTPERIQFVMAKALSEASLGFLSGWDWLKLQVFRSVSVTRFHLALERREMKSDTMAAHFSPDIAIGGIEHLAKLNMYYENFQHDLPRDDDAMASDTRLLSLLNVVESVHGITKPDALRLALNNRCTYTGNSRNLVKSVERVLDSQLLRDHIKKNYPQMQHTSRADV